MSLEEKLALLEEIMDLDEGTLAENTLLEEIEEWDSLSKLSLMAEAKKKFDKALTVEDIRGLKTVGDIINILN